MTKHVAPGFLVLALAVLAATRLTREPEAEAVLAPAHPSKVRDRAAETSSRPGGDFVLDLQFSRDSVEWPELGKERYLQRLDARFARLNERLALSPDQLDHVAAWREGIAARLDTTLESAFADRFATPRELEEFLHSLLTEDQAAALVAFMQEERSQLAAAITSSQFSCLEKVAGLKTEQQQVAAAIGGDVAAVVAFRLDDPRSLEIFISNLDKDPQALGIEQLCWDLWGDEGLTPDLKDPRKRQFIKELRARIDSRVASLEPVLTPEQLGIYREHLWRYWSDPFLRGVMPAPDSVR